VFTSFFLTYPGDEERTEPIKHIGWVHKYNPDQQTYTVAWFQCNTEEVFMSEYYWESGEDGEFG
jgi:hypothetical protein